jgi:hypothetical protein
MFWPNWPRHFWVGPAGLGCPCSGLVSGRLVEAYIKVNNATKLILLMTTKKEDTRAAR